MTVNIMELMSLKPKLKKSFADHPKVKPAEGGEGIRMNIKLNPDDIATLKVVKDLL